MTREEVYALHFLGTPLEIRLFLGGLILGALLGAVYDIFRAFRMTFRHGYAAVFVEDALFAFIFAAAFYGYCTELCRGQLRFFVFAAMMIGFVAYIATLGRLISGLAADVVKTVRKTIICLGKIAKKAIKLLCGVPYFQKGEEKFKENPCVKNGF